MEKNDYEIGENFIRNEGCTDVGFKSINNRYKIPFQYSAKSNYEEKEDGEIDDDREEEPNLSCFNVGCTKNQTYSIEKSQYGDEDKEGDDDFSPYSKKLKIEEEEGEGALNVYTTRDLAKINQENNNYENKFETFKIECLSSAKSFDEPEILNEYRDFSQINKYEKETLPLVNSVLTTESCFSKLKTAANEIKDDQKTPLKIIKSAKTTENLEEYSNKNILETFSDSNYKSYINGESKFDTLNDLSKNAEILKVPPLKIICTNSNGGHPYIKTELSTSKNEKSTSETNEEEDLELDIRLNNDINTSSSIELTDILSSASLSKSNKVNIRTSFNRRVTSSNACVSLEEINTPFQVKIAIAPSSIIAPDNKVNSKNLI